MRGWLNDVRSYVPPVEIGEKMRGASLATVMFSKVQGIHSGDTVIAPVRPVTWSSLKHLECGLV
jgi:NADPH-dependent curcumin reductase CurA